MIHFTHCVRRFAPALPLRGTSLREDGLHEATDTVFTHNYINTSIQFGLPLGTLPGYI
jgi:hypothetical protein